MGRRNFTRTIKIAAAFAVAAAVTAPPADATFPGEANGRIAFSGSHGGAYGIFTMQPDGSDIKHIVSGNAFDPSVAPHGGQIVFQYYNRIALAGIDGSGILMLTPASSGMYAQSPSWSPDGTKVVFSGLTTSPYDYGFNSDLYTVDVDGTDLTRVTNTPDDEESAPAWSPDGRRIAFVGRGPFTGPQWDGLNIYTMKPDGSDRLRVTNGGFNQSPDWAPDSSRLTFGHASGSHHSSIVTVKPDGTDFKDLGHQGSAPVFSPDGKQIVFSQNLAYPHWTYGLGIIPAAGGAVQNLSSGGTVASSPSWQPIDNVEYPQPEIPVPPAVDPKPPVPPKPPGLDIAAVHRAYVSTVVGNAARRLQGLGLRGLLRGLTISESVPAPGGLQIDVLGRAPGAKTAAARPTVLATGRGTAKAAGPVKLKLKTTKRGRKVVKKAKKMKVWVRVVYTPKGLKKTTSKAKPLVLKRKR